MDGNGTCCRMASYTVATACCRLCALPPNPALLLLGRCLPGHVFSLSCRPHHCGGERQPGGSGPKLGDLWASHGCFGALKNLGAPTSFCVPAAVELVALCCGATITNMHEKMSWHHILFAERLAMQVTGFMFLANFCVNRICHRVVWSAFSVPHLENPAIKKGSTPFGSIMCRRAVPLRNCPRQ